MSKIILTDIDDTILKFADAFQKWAVESKGYVLNQSIRDGGSIQDAIGCHRDHVDELIIEFSNDPILFSTIEPEPDAKAVIPLLHGMGYDFVAISSCVDGPAVTAARRHNLEQAFGIPWLDVHCTGLLQPKKAYLETFQPTWWVEDNAGHALTGAAVGHTTFLIERAYNELKTRDRPSGTVKWFDASKAHGFIVPDDGGGDVFVSTPQRLVGGQKVAFDYQRRDSGLMSALNVLAVNRVKSWHDVFEAVVRSEVSDAA